MTSTANIPQISKQESSAIPEIPDTEEKFHEIWKNKFVVPIPKEILSQCQIKLCEICGVSPKSLVEARVHYLGSKHLKQIARTLQNQGILREGQSWKKKEGIYRPDHDCKISGKNRAPGRNELCDGCRLGILEILGSTGSSIEKITKKLAYIFF